jgi:hypothetical protein|tara:strand:+ start:485 stop:1612 length:1128 start_codon:yes stop_codon:yes gene_type:complete
MNEFDKLTLELTKKLTLTEKKEYGIYFTPQNAIKTLVNNIPIKAKNILEPSCGSGEFIKYFNDNNITGLEINKTIYNKIKNKYRNILNIDFLKYDKTNIHDLIIGNPPFFTIKTNYISDLIYGRQNIYILFIIHSMKLIKNNGIIAFIIPINFMNSSYYNKIRKEIYHNWKIIDFIKYDDNIFIDTKQNVFGLIIQKTTGDNNKFVYIRKDTQYYFVFNKNILPSNNYKTLKDLGYFVGVGTIQWDVNKDLFVDKSKTILIYSSDINNNKLILKNKKYRYLSKDVKYLKEPMLILNRGYGNAKYNMNITLIDGTFNFQLENHVLFIKHQNNTSILELKKIQKSLQSDKTKEFINNLFYNNAINCFELSNIIPIWF